SLLDSPEIAELVRELQETRWTGRPGYPLRAMVGMALVKSLYALPTWSRTAALVREHSALQAVLGCCPSVYACYRFTTKLREHSDKLARCMDRIVAAVGAGTANLAIDASDMPAYANGQRYLSKNGPERERFCDPDPFWGNCS